MIELSIAVYGAVTFILSRYDKVLCIIAAAAGVITTLSLKLLF